MFLSICVNKFIFCLFAGKNMEVYPSSLVRIFNMKQNTCSILNGSLNVVHIVKFM